MNTSEPSARHPPLFAPQFYVFTVFLCVVCVCVCVSRWLQIFLSGPDGSGPRKQPLQLSSASPTAKFGWLSTHTRRGRLLQGAIMLLIVNLTWVGASELLKSVYEVRRLPLHLPVSLSPCLPVILSLPPVSTRLSPISCATA